MCAAVGADGSRTEPGSSRMPDSDDSCENILPLPEGSRLANIKSRQRTHCLWKCSSLSGAMIFPPMTNKLGELCLNEGTMM